MSIFFSALMILFLMASGCSSTGKGQFNGVSSEYKKMVESQKQRANAVAREEQPAKLPELKPQDYELMGDRFLAEGNNVKALLNYAKAVEANPAAANVRYKMGRVLLRQRLKGDALQQFEEIVKREPSNVLGYYGRALVHLAENDLERSKENLRRTIALDTGLWHAYALLGLVYDLQKQHSLAVEQFEKSLAINPRSAAVYNNLGISLHSMGEYERAVAAFEAALKIQHRNGKAYNNLGLSLYKLGRYDEAFEAFGKGCSEAGAYHNMGYLYMVDQSYEKSYEAFEKALDTSPVFYVKASENMKMVKAAMEKDKTVLTAP